MLLRRLAPSALLLLTLGLLAAPAPAAAVSRIDVATRAEAVITRITQRTTVPVYLPNTLVINGNGHKGFATGSARRRGWTIDFGYVRGCNGTHACELAYFNAQRGEQAVGVRVQLAHGIVGRYERGSCGASCAAPSIGFVIGGVLYTFSVTDPVGRPKPALIALANQAIRYGPR